MKSVKDFVMDDMWGHVMMTGPDIRGYLSGEKYPTLEEKKQYCQGILTMYPHMMLGNFSRWLWDGNPPKDYGVFMEQSAKALQSKVFPVLDQAFQPEISLSQRGALLVPLLTGVIPKHVLTGFYDYMFAGQKDYQDISSFWASAEPILSLTARMLRAAYDPDQQMSTEEKTEVFLFVGTRYAYLLLKRWYDWQFGEEKMEGPPGPPPEG